MVVYWVGNFVVGFAKGGLAACCPRCGPYKLDAASFLGSEEVCEDPSEYVSWDGLHLTEAAYKLVATSLLQGSNTIPQLYSVCPMYHEYGDFGISDH